MAIVLLCFKKQKSNSTHFFQSPSLIKRIEKKKIINQSFILFNFEKKRKSKKKKSKNPLFPPLYFSSIKFQFFFFFLLFFRKIIIISGINAPDTRVPDV